MSSKRSRFDPNDLSSLLADAEEFSHLLEQNEDEGKYFWGGLLFGYAWIYFLEGQN